MIIDGTKRRKLNIKKLTLFVLCDKITPAKLSIGSKPIKIISTIVCDVSIFILTPYFFSFYFINQLAMFYCLKDFIN